MAKKITLTGKAWSIGDLDYVAKEFAKEQQDRKAARKRAYRIGQRLDKVLSAEGKYGKGLLKKFLVEIKAKKQVSIEEQTAYGYLHFYRGARSMENACNLEIPRKYWEVLGTDKWGDDVFSLGLVAWFREHPLLEDATAGQAERIGKRRNGKPSADKLASVIELLKSHRARLKAIDPDAETKMDKLYTGPLKEIGKGWKEGEIEVSVFMPYSLALFQYDLSLLAGEHVRSLPLIMSEQSAKDLRLGNSEHKLTVDAPGVGGFDRTLKPTENEMLREHSAHGLARSRYREAAEIEIVGNAPRPTKQKLDEILKYGDSRKILTGDWVSPGSLDMVLTDPPYGTYSPWRESSRVEHNSEGSAEKNAQMVAEVASIIVKRNLHKKRFVWLSFCPTDLIHVFAPPLIDAFGPLKPAYQVLIWDKAIKPPAGGIQAYSSQCESILCFSVGRALSAAQPMGPIYIQRQEQGDINWKPVRLLRRLIAEYTYEQGRRGQRSGQIVLDPFCGKGGAGVASLFSGVDFRLVDSHKGQYADARIELTKAMNLLGKSKSLDAAWVEYIAQAKQSKKNREAKGSD